MRRVPSGLALAEGGNRGAQRDDRIARAYLAQIVRRQCRPD